MLVTAVKKMEALDEKLVATDVAYLKDQQRIKTAGHLLRLYRRRDDYWARLSISSGFRWLLEDVLWNLGNILFSYYSSCDTRLINAGQIRIFRRRKSLRPRKCLPSKNPPRGWVCPSLRSP